MNDDKPDAPSASALLADIKQQLDNSVDALDAVTCARLQAARLNALQTQGRRIWAIYAAPALMASLLVFSLAVFISTQPPGGATLMEDIQMLGANEEIDFYENLEFYQWLDAQQANG
jgi:hypothetical protein